jgi:hypothetical protein
MWIAYIQDRMGYGRNSWKLLMNLQLPKNTVNFWTVELSASHAGFSSMDLVR